MLQYPFNQQLKTRDKISGIVQQYEKKISKKAGKICLKEFSLHDQDSGNGGEDVRKCFKAIFYSVKMMQQHMVEDLLVLNQNLPHDQGPIDRTAWEDVHKAETAVEERFEESKSIAQFVSRYVILRGSTEGLDKVLSTKDGAKS